MNYQCTSSILYVVIWIKFDKDILMIESYFNMDIEIIFAGPNLLKEDMKGVFNERDGLTDSIELFSNMDRKPLILKC